MTILPSEGGSYLREPDGSLTRLEVAASVAAEAETPAETPQADASVEDTNTTDSGKKGKAEP